MPVGNIESLPVAGEEEPAFFRAGHWQPGTAEPDAGRTGSRRDWQAIADGFGVAFAQRRERFGTLWGHPGQGIRMHARDPGQTAAMFDRMAAVGRMR